MKYFLALLMLVSSLSWAGETVPQRFLTYKPQFIKAVTVIWLDMARPAILAGQIEQETCIRLDHIKCWNPTAKLETSREYGFGFGQLTITKKFNAFEEVKSLEPRLKGWKWDDRFNAQNQLYGVVSMMKRNYGIFKNVEGNKERYAFALASYNGGIGGIQADQKLCSKTRGCNPKKWFGNVERTSLKSKVKYQGYGKSFFEINREYPINTFNRMKKYTPHVETMFGGIRRD